MAKGLKQQLVMEGDGYSDLHGAGCTYPPSSPIVHVPAKPSEETDVKVRHSLLMPASPHGSITASAAIGDNVGAPNRQRHARTATRQCSSTFLQGPERECPPCGEDVYAEPRECRRHNVIGTPMNRDSGSVCQANRRREATSGLRILDSSYATSDIRVGVIAADRVKRPLQSNCRPLKPCRPRVRIRSVTQTKTAPERATLASSPGPQLPEVCTPFWVGLC